MKRKFLPISILLFLSFLLYGSSQSYAQQLYSSTDSVIVASTNTVIDWGRGFKFTPTQDMWVVRIGKRVPAVGNYSWAIWDATTQVKVFGQTSLLNQPGQYVYEDVDSVIKLNVNQQYILELYGSGSAQYYFANSSQAGPHITYMDMRYCNSCSNTTFPTSVLTNYHYGTPDFIYTLTPPVGGFNDAALTNVPTPTNFCPGTRDIKVIVSNSGDNKIDSVKINWTLDGLAQPAYSLYTPLDTLGGVGINQIEVTLGTHNFTTTPIAFKAWTTMPNGVVDPQNANDTVLRSYAAADYVVSAVEDSTCIGGSATMNLTPNTGYSVGDLQWQTSTNGTTWTDIPSTDNPSYTATNLSGNSFYRVKVIDGSSFCYSNSVAIAAINVEILTTTPGERCGDGTVNLSATSSAATTVKWYTQATGGTAVGTGNSFTTPILSSSTTYYVSASFKNCESTRDTVIATIKPKPQISLGNDTAICTNASFVLDAGNPGSTYLWNDNSTNQTLTISSAGIYSVLVTGANLCINTDTINVTVGIAPVNPLPPLTNLCVGSTTTLNAGNPGSTYLWDNTVATQSITVNTGGTYSVLITSADACTLTASTTVTMRPLPVVNLGNDTAICSNDQIVLDAGNPSMSYQWSTGASSQTIGVSSPNTYYVKVTSIYNCKQSDTIKITNLPSPSADGFNFIPLFNQQLGRVKFSSINPQNVTSLEWDFGDGSPISTAPSPTHTYASTGIYTVILKVFNECGEHSSSQNLNVQTLGITKLAEGTIDFALYPNPSNSEITIENGNDQTKMQHVSIVNMLGSLVYDAKTSSFKTQKINISKLASGLYTVRIFTDRGIVIKKFEVIK